MTLEQKVMTAMKTAMQSKNQDALRALRAIKASIQLTKTEKGASGELSEDKEIALLQKMIKQRKESAQIFKEQNRVELAQKEESEIETITNFLPEQMSHEEIEQTIEDLINKTGASSMKDMGKIMGMASKTFAGKAENSLISQIVKTKLS